MKKPNIIISALSLIIIFTSFASSNENNNENQKSFKKFKITAGVEKFHGYTQYQIGWDVEISSLKGSFPGKISELKFPLNVYMAYLKTEFKPSEKIIIGLGFKSNLTKDAGTMKDSDFGYWGLQGNSWASNSSLDIYSESDAELNAYIIDFDIKHQFDINPGLKLFPGVAFKYQHFDYEISDLRQWYPSYNSYSAYLSTAYGNHYYQSGKVLTYEVTYYIPFIKIGALWNPLKTVSIYTEAALSPYVIAKDVDDHVLRSKESKGTSTGAAYMFDINLDYAVLKNILVSLNANYTRIETSGEQDQTRYRSTSEGPAGKIATIDNKLLSVQYSFGISASYLF